MKVQLFLLVATTALFVALWSSDRQFQDTQLAIARAAHERMDVQETVSIDRQVASRNESPSDLRSPFAASSWIAPNVVTPGPVGPAGETAVRPPAVRIVPLGVAPDTVVVSVIVSFRRPSFLFDSNGHFEGLRQAESRDSIQDASVRNGSLQNGEGRLKSLLQWAGRIRFEIDGETCWLRWQLRRTTFVARRLAMIFVARQLNWRDLVQKLARGAVGRFDAPSQSAASPGMAEER